MPSFLSQIKEKVILAGLAPRRSLRLGHVVLQKDVVQGLDMADELLIFVRCGLGQLGRLLPLH